MASDYPEHDQEFIEALEKAASRLDTMLIEQKEIEKRRLEVDYAVGKLVQKILHIAALCDDVPESLGIDRLKKSIQGLEISNAVREVLKGAEKPLTLADIRDRLEQIGIDVVALYQNYGAVLNIVLKRLTESGEIEEMPAEEGKTKRSYVWIPAKPETIFKPRPTALKLD